MIELALPFPPSVNHYYRHVGARTLISRGGRAYRDAVVALLRPRRSQPLTGRLMVAIQIHPPDRRRRDLDNVQKSLLDALQHAGVYADDSQIDTLTITRRDPVSGGAAVVAITEVA
jgi:crossover junction endodeoxyribonuclease RusA